MYSFVKTIKNASEVDLSKISPSDSIDYAMIVGRVKTDDGAKLVSNYNKNTYGPIRLLEIKEHGTKWRNNVSTDTTRLVLRDLNNSPFSLINGKFQVKVEQPLNSEYILESLEIVYTNFEPTKQSTFSKILQDLALNERTRGIETTEKMLKEGVQLTAFGRIERFNNEFHLSSPIIRNKGQTFILTNMSRVEFINRLKSVTKSLKIVLLIFGSIGVSVSAYCAYKFLKEYLEKKKRAEMLEKARQERINRLKNRRRQTNRTDTSNDVINSSNNNGKDNEDDTREKCVICLTNPRELVLLPCGHVCLCMGCLDLMPNRNCPICRQEYRDYVPCFIP
jgi:E3 ubiquitin-protein ligase MUL1